MRSLEDVVRSGQALHIGVSDTPAWIIAQANTLAAMRGWEPFTAVQAEYSLIERSAERELLPMAKAFGLAFTPWAPLAGGALTGKYLQPSAEQKRLSPQSKRVTGRNIDIAAAVVDAARELGWSPAQVALVWCRQREETVVPIAGARKLEQMHDILGAEGKLLPQEIKLKLDEISKIDLGFPHEFLQSDAVKDIISGGTFSKIVH
jgi:aryl-alcohol dehydrogenase-like predicted oxidoreductase